MDPAERKKLEEQIQAASARERELWERVKGKHPGQPGHDDAVWQEWLEAAELVRRLWQMLRGPTG